MVSGLFVLVAFTSSIKNILVCWGVVWFQTMKSYSWCVWGGGLCDDVHGINLSHQHPISQTSNLCSELPYMLLTWFTWLVKFTYYLQVSKSPCCGCSHVCGSHLMVVQCLPPTPQLLDGSIYRIDCDVFVLAYCSSISMKVWVGSKSQQVWFTNVCCICVCLCRYCSGEVVLDMFSKTFSSWISTSV